MERGSQFRDLAEADSQTRDGAVGEAARLRSAVSRLAIIANLTLCYSTAIIAILCLEADEV